jgi:hypothetical protein
MAAKIKHLEDKIAHLVSRNEQLEKIHYRHTQIYCQP